jgi:drug/metabolite transporter (DMT)-like permease
MQSTSTARNAKAIVWVVLGTAVFSIFYTSGKFAGDLASPLQVVFLRYVGGFVTLACIVTFSSKSPAVYISHQPFSHFLRAVFGCYGGVAIVYSSAKMPVIDATAISLLYVVFIIPLGVIFLGEQIQKSQWAAILLSGIGAAIVMMSRGAFQTLDAAYLWPASVALSGAMLLAMEGILIRTLSQTDRAMTVLLHVNFFGVFLVLPPAILTWGSTDLATNLQFLLLGPIAITAQYFVIRGYRIADVSVVSPVDYTWLVFAAIIGYFFFDEIPTMGVVLGALLITIGGVWLAALRPSPTTEGPPKISARGLANCCRQRRRGRSELTIPVQARELDLGGCLDGVTCSSCYPRRTQPPARSR